MSYSTPVLLIIKNPDQRKLYHEFLVNEGFAVYLCDGLANALVQLVMFPSINTVVVDTDFSSRNLEDFLRILVTRAEWKKLAILLIDTADKGNVFKKVLKNRHFVYTQEIDPQKIIVSLKKLIENIKA